MSLNYRLELKNTTNKKIFPQVLAGHKAHKTQINNVINEKLLNILILVKNITHV